MMADICYNDTGLLRVNFIVVAVSNLSNDALFNALMTIHYGGFYHERYQFFLDRIAGCAVRRGVFPAVLCPSRLDGLCWLGSGFIGVIDPSQLMISPALCARPL